MININHRECVDDGNEERPLLASRVIKSLPVVRSLWGFGVGVYDATKNSHALIRAGFELAEDTAEPFVQRYKAIDSFASDKVDKLNQLIESGTDTIKSFVPSANTVLHTAAYPIGYAYGLALGSMNVLESSIEGTPLQRVAEKVYDIADAVIDGVLPPKEAEKHTQEDKSESALRRKNPVRRIGKRASLQAIRALPSNSIKYAMQLTKRYTRAATIASVDYGTVFLWNRADSSFRNVERVVNFLVRFEMVRNLLALPLPVFYQLTDKYELTQRIRHDGAQFISSTMITILTQLDFLHELVQSNYPLTSEVIEKLSLCIYNLQSLLESSRTKKRERSFDDDDEGRLKKREKFIEPGKREEKANAWQKVKVKKHHVKPVAEKPAVHQAPQVSTPNNPYTALLSESRVPEEEIKPTKPKAVHKEEEEKHEAQSDEKKKQQEEQAKEAARLKKLAKLEMKRWAQQEREEAEERARHERENKFYAEQAAKEKALKAAEEEKALKERNLQKEIKRRAKEKQMLEQQAKEAQLKAENEALEKQIAHALAHQKYMEEKVARDKELRQKKKREAVERAVQAALAAREKEEWKANAPQRAADENANKLIEEEAIEKAQERAAEKQAEDEAKELEAKRLEKKLQQKEKKKQAKEARRHAAESGKKEVEQPIREEDKEVSVIGGTVVVDEHTNWTVHTNTDEQWQTVQPKHATHLHADVILNPPPIKDADHHTAEQKHNPYFALDKSSQHASSLAPSVGGASV